MPVHISLNILQIHMNGIFYTKKNGESVAIYLPVIVYKRKKALTYFPQRDSLMETITRDLNLKKKVSLKGKCHSKRPGVADEENLPLDFSMTKTVMGMVAPRLYV